VGQSVEHVVLDRPVAPGLAQHLLATGDSLRHRRRALHEVSREQKHQLGLLASIASGTRMEQCLVDGRLLIGDPSAREADVAKQPPRTAYLRADVAVAQPPAFVVITGIL